MKLFNNPEYKVCARCGTLINKGMTTCPNCKLSQPPWQLILLIPILFLFFSLSIFYQIEQKILKINKSFKSSDSNMVENLEQDSQGVNIRVKPMIKLSGLSVDEVLKIRKDAVADTIAFGDVSKYEPNRQVFSIEDGLPWIGAYEASCKGIDNNQTIGEGESRESLGVVNPELLYYFIIPSYDGDHSFCSAADYMIPRRLIYHQDKKTLAAYIDYSSLLKARSRYYKLHPSDANAHDFGYSWAYADKTYNIKFASGDNFSNQMTPVQGYWHRGYACGLKDGCNNYSPRNMAMEFEITNIPASINIKLWKNEPKSPKQNADINYMIVFE